MTVIDAMLCFTFFWFDWFAQSAKEGKAIKTNQKGVGYGV
jgi:hypothetical protein